MSGIFSDNTGIGMVTATQMAVEDFGGKVSGKPIQVIFANHQNKPDVANGIARDWIDAVGSAVALTVQALAAAKDRVLLNIGSGGSDLKGKACAPVSVQWVWDTYAVGSGRAMLRALIEGEQSAVEMARLARGRMQRKEAELARALDGHVDEHHSFVLRLQLRRITAAEADLELINARLREKLAPYDEAIGRLMQIPGVDWVIAGTIVVEIGIDMARSNELASWYA